MPTEIAQAEATIALNFRATEFRLETQGKSALDLCKLCLQAGAELQHRRQTTNHILFLNGYKVRYTWSHNNLIE